MRSGSLAGCLAPARSSIDYICRQPCRQAYDVRRRAIRSRAVERDLDWEPEIKTPPAAPPRPNYMPPPPPPPPPRVEPQVDAPFPFRSRREIALTMLGGSVGYWLLKQNVIAPIDSFGAKPPIDFTLSGYTDLQPEDFVYFKTPGGRWMAAAEDEQGRFFMIDEVGDLYYNSGDPEIGLYAMDTQGNLFNFYVDTDGQQKITPVGNVADLKKFKIEEIAGIKLDREVTVVAFQDGTTAPLPPGSTYVDPLTGQVRGPEELIEGLNSLPGGAGPRDTMDEVSSRRNLFNRLFGGMGQERVEPPLQRFEVDLSDPREYDEQMSEQQFLADPDLGGRILPPDFDVEALGRQVEAEMKAKGR